MSMTREKAINAFEAIKLNAQNHLGKKYAAGCEGYYQDRIELADAALSSLRPVSREQVERIRGTWEPFGGKYLTRKKCSRCGWDGQEHIKFYSWCPNCGSPMTDEAVEMVMERWKEAIDSEAKTD